MSANDALAARQRDFVEALARRGAEVPGLAPLAGIEGGVERGLQAYRINAQALAAQSLAIVYPRVLEELGPSFDAMAWAFWRAAPPARGDLGEWGGALAGFLAEQDGMDAALVELAALEWACHEAERARDAELDTGSLALLSQTPPDRLGLRLRPGVRLLEMRDGAMLVWRRDWRATSRAIDATTAALMRALQGGRTLATALDAANVLDADFDFAAWLQAALGEGWLEAAFAIPTEQDL